MSQATGLGGPTPRRSGRLSSKAGSVNNQSTVTALTAGGTRQRKQKPLTKAKARKSNAYGASGRVGDAEEQVVTVTGFSQAFHTKRDDAVDRDDEEEQEGDDSGDELGPDFMMSGALNGRIARVSPAHERSSPPPRRLNRFPLSETPELPFTDDDLDISIGDGSKSFGMEHEAGMLHGALGHNLLLTSGLKPAPVAKTTLRPLNQSLRAPVGPLGERGRAPVTAKATPAKSSLDQSIDELLAEERARLQREGPPRPKPTGQATSRHVPPLFARPTLDQDLQSPSPFEPRADLPRQAQSGQQQEPRSELSHRSQVQQRSKRRNPEGVQQWLGQVEPADDFPSSEILEDEPEWRHLPAAKKGFWICMIVIIIYLLALFAATTFTDPKREVTLAKAARARVTTFHHDLAEMIMPKKPMVNETKALLTWLDGDGTRGDHLIWSRMWKNHGEYKVMFSVLESAIEKIKEELPEVTVVRLHPDGHLEITDDFWTALLSKTQSQSDDPTWAEYLRANKEKVDDMNSKPTEFNATKIRPQIIDRNELIGAMQEHYKIISEDVDAKIIEALTNLETKVKAELKSVVQTEARLALLDNVSLQSLAQSNLVANYELNIKKPNYFSPVMGALVDPNLTSATHTSNATSFGRMLLGMIYSVKIRRPNAPIAALMRWEELGECWCAAPNPMIGYARVGISLFTYMYPKQVTIEHAPISMSPTGDVRNAPRTIELWAETDQPIRQIYGASHTKCLDPGDLQSVGYVCLGSFKYNVHAANHIQTFDLDAELTVPTSRVVVQVTSNWGAANTCIYRMRLHGDDAKPKPEYKVTLDD